MNQQKIQELVNSLSVSQLQLIQELTIEGLKKHQSIQKGHVCTNEWIRGNPCDRVYGCPTCEKS